MVNDIIDKVNIHNKVKVVDSVKKQAAASMGLTDPKKVIGSSIRGINFLNTGVNAGNEIDLQGITFFTRPYLNLSEDNISDDRRMTGLLTKNPHSLQYAIRRLLDSKFSISLNTGNTALIDERMPFMAIFTNLLTGISGWPDETMDMYVSEPGLRNEVYMLVDHLSNKYSSFDLTATFRNIDGDPITTILTTWLTYAKAVSIGAMMPYPEMIVNRIIDYQTRIYRLVLDVSRRWILKIACCGAATPTANPLGTSFNFSSDTPIVDSTLEQSVPFKAIGYCYNDPIIARDFNLTVCNYNPYMSSKTRALTMVQIPPPLYKYFNYRCYPRISDNMELQWWCSNEVFSNTIELMGLEDDKITKESCTQWFKTN